MQADRGQRVIVLSVKETHSSQHLRLASSTGPLEIIADAPQFGSSCYIRTVPSFGPARPRVTFNSAAVRHHAGHPQAGVFSEASRNRTLDADEEVSVTRFLRSLAHRRRLRQRMAVQEATGSVPQ